ncbi:holo-ACP synthase/triphosphoribosyl-dephospho-CoA synthase [Balneicella halophila]|uniref:Holo-ACP synthase/triphosphoribosyl-dephospho-CoA synthase n=1 Tax=Balneicella halophila TaxID=1537566 RepID=A0A7L4UME5_BALHA|nr:triphosphoribosyl-dephospho-CoA synthase [Balneicella halophila]PVX49404.1 holo-ACP synthase/triphosphoribosyl-dephospho-CoA synthase [Balneicella halophila]
MTTSNNEEILTNILKDREERFALRNSLAERGLASISLNFNIPGYPKSSEILKNAFNCVQNDLLRFLVAHRIHKIPNTQHYHHSDNGNFFLQGVAYVFEDEQVKKFLEDFEQTHPLERLLDVDLMNSEGEMISSGKDKKCFLCDHPAKKCMKEKRHSFEEYNNYVNEHTQNYLATIKKNLVISIITEKAIVASLYEVSVEDKPGLVCPSSNGAHTDMDFFTFLSSSGSLSNYWRQTAKYGYKTGRKAKESVDFKEIRKNLRLMGLEAEEAMYTATNGVNTQKGMIFLIGLASFASAAVFANSEKFSQEAFQAWVQKIMKGIVDEDFDKGHAQHGTHGEEAFKKYGKHLAGGARHEAEQGFPTVFNYAIGYLNAQIGDDYRVLTKEDWQEVLTNLLMLIISKSNDINILYRKNQEALRQVQCHAARVLTTPIGYHRNQSLKNFGEYCMFNNISPGGAADLLALSLFVYFIENLDFTHYSLGER